MPEATNHAHPIDADDCAADARRDSRWRRARSIAAFGLYGVFLGAVVLTVWACHAPGSKRGEVDGLKIARGEAVDIRVRLESSERAATIGGSPAFLVGPEGSRGVRSVPGPVRVVASGGGIRVIDARGRTHGFPTGTSLSLAPSSGRSTFGDKSYPGTLVAVPRGADAPDRLDLINDVDIEAYLPGVLAQELYASWPLETYRAQAVAARSYALAERARSRDRGRYFDVEDDQRDQAYIGITDRTVAIDAATSTRGIVLTAYDRIMPAFYSSTCGGRSALAEEVWPERATTNFLLVAARGGADTTRPFACESAPLYRWQVERPRWALGDRLRGFAIERDLRDLARIGQLHSIAPTRESGSGRPIEYRVTDVHGTSVMVPAETLRVAMNSNASGTGKLRAGDIVRSSDFEVTVTGSRVRISGRGFGHGVGMCQYCAKNMAERGQRAESMLEMFYPTGELRRAY